MRRPLLVTTTALALLLTSGGVAAQDEGPEASASPEPGASPTAEQLAAAEERLATATCLGKPATMVAIAGFETIGTPGADVIVGTEGDDLIRGEGGDDRICSGPGADLVEGGDGKDRIDGGLGDDTLDGGAGNDTIDGGKGADLVTGAAGNDRLSGATGDDVLNGGRGNDVCTGGPGHDWLPGCNDKRGTRGKLIVKKSTTLKGPHRGSIVIAADKVTLDCGGHAVTGRGGGDGISLYGRSRVTIKDCDVSNFTNGISLSESNHNTLTGNRANENGINGFLLNQSSRNRLIGNVADENGFGSATTGGFTIWAVDNVFKRNSASGNGEANFGGSPARSTFEGNTASGGWYGFQVAGDHSEYRDNTVSSARDYGFFLGSGDDNIVADNTVVDSGIGFYFEGSGNRVVGNTALDSARIGFEERSAVGSNDYVDNVCIGAGERASTQPGICSTTLRPTPEPSPQPSSDTGDSEVARAEE